MVFSTGERCRYAKNPLGEVICQLRFPEILIISANMPVDFQEAIRRDYPQYLRRVDPLPPKAPGVPGDASAPTGVVNYQFASADGVWKINLTSKFISLSCTRYTQWEDFAAHLDQPLASFIQVYKPAYFERIGLRYLNFISRKQLELDGTPFSHMIAPCYLGPMAEEDFVETNATRCTVDAEFAIRGGCRAKIHAGPGMVRQGNTQDQEVKFIFDQDLSMSGNLQISLAAGALQTLHSQADSIFRGAVTDLLHNAMEPHII